MTLKLHHFTCLIVLMLLSCKNEKTFKDFQFSDKDKVITCAYQNEPLLNEALYSFENDLNKYYSRLSRQNLSLAYSRFINGAINGRIKLTDIASSHTVKVFKALKNENLWDAENPKSHLNYTSPFFKCIVEKIKDDNLKKTLAALIETSSMSPELFGPAIASNYRAVISDKYLATYVAFDLFYAKLFDVDLSQVNLKSDPYDKVDFNKIPR